MFNFRPTVTPSRTRLGRRSPAHLIVLDNNKQSAEVEGIPDSDDAMDEVIGVGLAIPVFRNAALIILSGDTVPWPR
jgi:hypothetical protein